MMVYQRHGMGLCRSKKHLEAPLQHSVEGIWLCWHFDLGLLTQNYKRINACSFKPPNLWCFITTNLEIKSNVLKFVETYRVTLKFVWKLKEPRIATTILKKNNKVEGLTNPLWFQDSIKGSHQDSGPGTKGTGKGSRKTTRAQKQNHTQMDNSFFTKVQGSEVE